MEEKVADQLFETGLFFFSARFFIDKYLAALGIELIDMEGAFCFFLVDKHPVFAVDPERYFTSIGEGEFFAPEGNRPDKAFIHKVHFFKIIRQICHEAIITEIFI